VIARSTDSAGPLTIFIAHPSHLLTDSWHHGDGLVANGFLRELARRGHRLHVAVERMELAEPFPPNVTLYQIEPLRGLPGRLGFMLSARLLFERLRAGARFDAIHQMNPVYTGLSLAFAGTGVPVVLGTYIGDWTTQPPRGRAARARYEIGRAVRDGIAALQQHCASALLLTTPAAAARLPRAARPGIARKIHLLGNGIDLDRFAPPARKSDDGRTVLFLGSVARKKGIFTLLEAFAVVRERAPQARLLVAGGGDDLDEVRRRAAGLGESVVFTGRVAPSEVPRLLHEATIFCVPSLGEPYGMSALEAMAAGLPVVATDAGGLAHLVPAEGGAKVRAGDAAQLAEALLGLLGDESRRERCGAANRAYVRATFGWEHVGDRLESIYRSLAPKPGRVRRAVEASA
jgi:glycosyltransferase involved in cell wall biosynthesis